jgi:two-component system phosphate regulon sensor histidine kinase PhoR
MQTDVIQIFLNALPMPALAIDADALIVAMNSGGNALFGTQSLNRNYITMLRQPSVLDTIEATLQDGKDRNATYQSTVNGTETAFDVSCRGIKKPAEDTVNNVVLCFQDVTDINHAGQMRRDFVANVSHELRTPLTAMIGFIETLSGPAREDTAARTRFLPIMLGEAQRMSRLVGELLSLSRVEVDERVKPTAQVCLNDILRETLDAIRPLADLGNVALEVDLPADPLHLIGDRDQLRQVFTNLIENAIKYGGDGERVTVRMTLSERDEALRRPGCRIEVIDYGVGIAPIHLPRLTERFYRVDDHRSRELGGTGLGLAIVKHIINRHRAQMRITSTPGQGTTFSVILPVVSETQE